MPDRGFPIDGWRSTDFTRIGQGWFGVVVQRLWEHEDGRREWRKDAAAPLKIGKALPREAFLGN